ncbi:carboxylesterase/lipase family protein [Nonomuraea lactucae]|uniref:carboxylesterase/lipase family protein n=1 Tax=Nonomuraea lactucae TaxID=2249762 RepID=UPI000DE51626|nr:carboxylesterase family protein [Nonomuraea lactucae]
MDTIPTGRYLAQYSHGAASLTAALPPADLVRTDNGVVRGQVLPDHRAFRGIPYAAPPTGELRWRSPRPARPWSGIYDATFPRSQCAQLAPAYGGQTTFSENCLHLNVFTPRRTRSGLPVMLWIHGGADVNGNGAAYLAAPLAVKGDAIVVTINYRLGAIGWLAYPGLAGSGNYGLLDQQAAMRWVRDNIAAFGGDPGNVTLFGESAGAANICANLASPKAAGLFHKAIPQSYSCAAPTRDVPGAQADGRRLAQAVGCADVACLRSRPVQTLLEAWRTLGLNPYSVAGGTDGVLPLAPRAALESGRFAHVPVMHGNTLDEMRLFLSQPITVEQYEARVRQMFGARADRVLTEYPADAYPEPRHALATLATDYPGGALSTCLHLDALALFRRAGVPVYAYQFADRAAPPLIDVLGFDEGAEHATELSFIFPGLLGRLSPEQERLSDAMIGYWSSFARKGRPETGHAPRWRPFHSSADVLRLAPGRHRIQPTDTAVPSK